MKGIFKTLLVALFVTFSFAGCNYEIINEGVDMDVIYIDAKKNNWQIFGKEGVEGCYQFQEFKFPEITNAVLNEGAVLVYYKNYHEDKYGREHIYDDILPYVLPYDAGRETVIETIRFDCEKGYLTLIIEASDFMAVPLSEDIRFKVCILKPF